MPPPDLVARFAHDLEALTAAPAPRLGVAVSGGPDSLALLLLAAAAYPGRVEAATVDHRVRPANAAEARAVEAICASLGVRHQTLRADDPLPPRPSQAWARALRYALLEDWATARDLPVLLTAHHLDDQAETLLMRANRGSGVGGLAAIRPASPMAGGEIRLLRPLLGWRRSELAGIVAASGLGAADDPSNRDPAYDRTAARALLAGEAWLHPVRLAAAARHAADADAALAWTAEHLWRERREAGSTADEVRLNLADLPSEHARRLILAALAEVRDHARLPADAPPRGAAIDRLLRRAAADRAAVGPLAPWSATLAGVRVAVRGDAWRFAPAPPRRSPRRSPPAEHRP